MSLETEVRQASQNFYAALNRMGNGEKGAMENTWSHSPSVTAMHPIGGRTTGWDAVRDSFDQVADMSSDCNIALKDQVVQVIGDIAYELGVEHGDMKMAGHHANLEHRVTNIYKREGGIWKLIHHHTDVSRDMLDVLGRLKPPSP